MGLSPGDDWANMPPTGTHIPQAMSLDKLAARQLAGLSTTFEQAFRSAYGFMQQNAGGANIQVYRQNRTGTTQVVASENGQIVGGFVGNSTADGKPDYTDSSRGIPDGNYSLLPKPVSQYTGKHNEFAPGTPSVTGRGRAEGSPVAGWNNIRFHPCGGSKGCVTGPLEWANRVWDMMDRHPRGHTTLQVRTIAYPHAIPAGNPSQPPSSHPWPPFNYGSLDPFP